MLAQTPTYSYWKLFYEKKLKKKVNLIEIFKGAQIRPEARINPEPGGASVQY